jgi:ribosomal protein L6P/L9E
MPLSIKVDVRPANLFCFFSFNLKVLNAFIILLKKKITLLKFPFFIKLFLKGLGYKLKSVKLGLESFLECKLGYSNLIFLKIPSNSIVVTLKKTSLVLSGFCKVEIGNFANQIYNLRPPNVYTSKGFRYKRQRVQLKAIKKT